jgi:hypothetical protein
MKSSERFKKFAPERLYSTISWCMVAAFLIIGVSSQASESALTSVSKATANVTAERWITPSIEAFPADYRSGTVNWQKAGGYTSYDLQWGLTSDFSGATTVRVNALSYSLSGLTATTTYYFRVRAVGAPTATWSSVASMTTPLQAPTTQSVLFSTSDPHGAALDSKGNIWIADWVEGIVKKVTPAGAVTPIGTAVTDSHPRGLSLVNDTTAVFVRSFSDAVNDASTGLYTLSSSGVATMRAQFYRPYGTVYSKTNNKVYVSHERYLDECDYTTWVCTQVMEQPSNNIGHLNITPDGSKITMAGGNNNVLSVYDTRHGCPRCGCYRKLRLSRLLVDNGRCLAY